MDVSGYLIVPVKWDGKRWVEGPPARFVRRFPTASADGHQVVLELRLAIDDAGIDPPVVEIAVPAEAVTVQAQAEAVSPEGGDE